MRSADDDSRPNYTRAERRRRQRIATKVDRVTWGDKLYFLRFPQRRHRVRVSHPAELDEMGIPDAPPGYRQFAVVKNLGPDIRKRLFVLNVADAETDLPEEVARAIFERACASGPKGRIRRAVRS